MFMNSPRLASLIAAVLVLIGTVPAAAADPVAPTAPPQSEPGPAGQPTIHAEMLASTPDAAEPFVEGAVPEPLLSAGASVQADSGQGGIGFLPNGMTHEVYGYLPYWALSSSLLQHLRYDLVSTIAYFSVVAQPDGTLLRSGTGWNGWTSSHMTDVINRAHARGVHVHLTVTMFAWGGDYSAMSELLNNPTNRARLASDIASTVAARNADGVNLDFEPMSNSLQSQYTTFVREVKAALVAAGTGSYLTVAATGGAASWDEGYDLAGLTASGAADAIMVMGYDFSWSGSTRAGGVAPIYSPYILDVGEAMSAYLARVPASKLIWGVPYYGRAWTTQTSVVNSLTCKSQSICPDGNWNAFGRSWAPRYVDALHAAGQFGKLWDVNGRVPWYTYFSSEHNAYVQGYYDDTESLNAKYAMVKANRMRGVGIWHLLMDVDRPELWGELRSNFATWPFDDIWNSPFREDIVWLVEAGITTGCGGGHFCPKDSVTREQMASFLKRALNLPPTDTDFFTDDASSVHQVDINKVAAAGITTGCAPGLYCPKAVVSREQMASFLARALNLPPTSTDYFTDDEPSPHEADINRLAAAGITTGCGGTLYCPRAVVTREQMAAFLRRALD